MANKTTIIGTIGTVVELRYTPSGTPVASFSVADNRGKGDEQKTTWWNVKCWKQTAENVADSLQKGMRVIVDGVVEEETWDDKEGNERRKMVLVGWNIGPDLSFASAVVTKNER